MRIVFMGTSDFAVPSLKKLINSEHDLVGIVTQPDRPRGRGKKIIPTRIKQLALEHNLPILQAPKIRELDAIKVIQNWQPDVIVVVAYGQIIPADILNYPKAGCVNIHPSLLPKYRGPAPIQAALMAGDKITGITTMFMDQTLDTGDIIMQIPVNIDDDMDFGKLQEVLADKGANLLLETLDAISRDDFVRTKQDENMASYFGMITRDDEKIDWSCNAEDIMNRVRALSPVPGAYSTYQGTKIKIFVVKLIKEADSGVPGQVLEITPKGFTVQTGKGIVEILEVQKEGKKRILCNEFLRGFNLKPGSILGT